MVMAEDFKCKDCGSTWYWTEEDYAEIERMRRGGALAAAVGVLTTHGSYSISDAVTNHHLISKGAQMQSHVIDFSRCPNCGSREIKRTGSHVVGADNPFLNNAGTMGAAGGTPSTAQSVKKPLTAGLLGILLGGFGAHKFYLGYKKEGTIMLVVWLLGLITMAVPSIIMSIIGLVEGIIYLTRDTYAFQTTYVRGHKGWF